MTEEPPKDKPSEKTTVPLSNKTSFWERVTLPIVISLLAILTTWIIFNINSCNQYSKDQNDFHPELKVAKADIKEISIVTDSITKGLDGVMEFQSHLGVKINYVITNIGNTTADLRGQAYSEAPFGTPIIKNHIKNHPDLLDLKQLQEGYYHTTEIRPGDTITEEVLLDIQNFNKNEFTIHAFFIYQNRDKQFFDTYYHTRFWCSEQLPLKVHLSNDKTQLVQVVQNKDLRSFIKLVDSNSEQNKYSRKEKSTI